MPKSNPNPISVALTEGEMFYIPKEKFTNARGALQQRRGYLRRKGFQMKYIHDSEANGYYIWAVPTPWSHQ
jgi:hypothetical protein